MTVLSPQSVLNVKIFNFKESLVLLDGCQNISNIGCSSIEDLMEKSPLPSEVVKKVQQFFERDCVII